MGLQLFVSGEDDWIRHQKVYTEFEEFGGWFSDYSSALLVLQVLDRGDIQLGLVVVGGKEGGYRGVVMEMLENWVMRTNKLFREVFDELADDNPRARVRMFSDAVFSEEYLEEGEDENNDN